MSTFENFSAEQLNQTALLMADRFGRHMEEFTQAEENVKGTAEVLALITAERKRRKVWHKLHCTLSKAHCNHAVKDLPPAPVGWKIGQPIPE